MIHYAHSLPGHPTTENWQTLEAHSAGVASRARSFASGFDSGDWAENAAWLHDLGKLDSIFQGYLLRENGLDDANYDSGRINHSSAGAACAEEALGPCVGRILAYLIAGHHAGLADWYTSDAGSAALSKRLDEAKENYDRIRVEAKSVLSHLIHALSPPLFLRKHPENLHLWMRMLFSALVDADYLDTWIQVRSATHWVNEIPPIERRGEVPDRCHEGPKAKRFADGQGARSASKHDLSGGSAQSLRN